MQVQLFLNKFLPEDSSIIASADHLGGFLDEFSMQDGSGVPGLHSAWNLGPFLILIFTLKAIDMDEFECLLSDLLKAMRVSWDGAWMPDKHSNCQKLFHTYSCTLEQCSGWWVDLPGEIGFAWICKPGIYIYTYMYMWLITLHHRYCRILSDILYDHIFSHHLSLSLKAIYFKTVLFLQKVNNMKVVFLQRWT